MKVGPRNILFVLIQGQTRFGMPRGAKMSLALNKPKVVARHSNLNTTSKHAPHGEKSYIFTCKAANRKS